MSEILTPWGYDILSDEPLPELMSAPEFQTATGGKYGNDQRIPHSLRAASAAIRNYCGWHLYPVLPCRLASSLYDLKVTISRNELMVQLPAKVVQQVSAVSLNGVALTGYTVERNGILHIYDIPEMPSQRRETLTVEYTAGLSDMDAADIKDIATARAVRGLSGTAGVQTEQAGGVSVTYNADWVKGNGAGALSPIDAQTLSVWRLQGVF